MKRACSRIWRHRLRKTCVRNICKCSNASLLTRPKSTAATVWRPSHLDCGVTVRPHQIIGVQATAERDVPRPRQRRLTDDVNELKNHIEIDINFRDRVHITSAIPSGFQTPSPPCPNYCYRYHVTSHPSTTWLYPSFHKRDQCSFLLVHNEKLSVHRRRRCTLDALFRTRVEHPKHCSPKHAISKPLLHCFIPQLNVHKNVWLLPDSHLF